MFGWNQHQVADMTMLDNFVDDNNSGQVYFNATDNLNLYGCSRWLKCFTTTTNRNLEMFLLGIILL